MDGYKGGIYNNIKKEKDTRILAINASDVLDRQQKFLNGFYDYEYSDNEEESQGQQNTSASEVDEK